MLHPDGTILDGRNRHRVCVLLDLEPRFTTWEPDGKSEADFVIDLNLHRRHLTSSQRAMIGSKYATLRNGQRADYAAPQKCGAAEDRSAAEAAHRVGVSPRMVEHAKALVREAPPAVLRLVEKGQMTITGAQDVLAHATPSERVELEDAVKPIAEDVPPEKRKEIVVEREKRVRQVRTNSQRRRREKGDEQLKRARATTAEKVEKGLNRRLPPETTFGRTHWLAAISCWLGSECSCRLIG